MNGPDREPPFTCKRSGFVDRSCCVPCDCATTRQLKSPGTLAPVEGVDVLALAGEFDYPKVILTVITADGMGGTRTLRAEEREVIAAALRVLHSQGHGIKTAEGDWRATGDLRPWHGDEEHTNGFGELA